MSPAALADYRTLFLLPAHQWWFTGKSLHSVALPAASNIGMMSPQLAGAIPSHLLNAQMRAMQIGSPPPPHMLHGGMSAAMGGPGPASLMRAASSSGNAPSTADDTSGTVSHQASSGAPTPVPSSSTSQAGHAGPPQHSSMAGFPPQMLPGQHGIPAQMLQQGYVFHPGQPHQQQQQPGFPGQHGAYRFAPGQQGGAQAVAGGHMPQILIGPNGQPVQFAGHPTAAGHGPFVPMQPFSPQMHAANGQMFSPQMGGQMGPGRKLHHANLLAEHVLMPLRPTEPYMSPVFMHQTGPRGTPQMAPAGQHVFYQQMGAPPSMQGQFVPMQYAGGPPQPGQPHQPNHAQQQQQHQQ